MRRAAAFLWIVPFEAAFASRFCACRDRSPASAAPDSAAVYAAFTRVLSSERTVLFRTRRFSFWRLRLIWLLMLATGGRH